MRKALAAIVFVCTFHESYIFHVVCEGNLPSFQCKKSFNWCMPMGEVGGQSLLFMNPNVPARPPLLHCDEIALEPFTNATYFVISGIKYLKSAKRPPPNYVAYSLVVLSSSIG